MPPPVTEIAGDRIVLGGNPLYLFARCALSVWFAWLIAFPYLVFGWPASSRSLYDLLRTVTESSSSVGLAGIYAVWQARVKLTVDLLTKRYVWERGVAPLIVRRKGSLEEFSHITFRRERHHSHYGTSMTYRLTLERKDGRLRRPSFWYVNAKLASDETLLARRLSLPIENIGDR